MSRLFGKDGIRGAAVTELSCELCLDIGRAAAAVLAGRNDERTKILVGKDTRSSADALEAAVCAGLCSAGADAEILGIVPAPALAYLIKERGARGGIMISASNRSADYNGIKIYSSSGCRLDAEEEDEIERLILDDPDELRPIRGGKYGKTIRYMHALEDYIDHVRSVSVSGDFSGIRVAVDCANGSASYTAGQIFSALGAEVIITGNKPDGTNINRGCGSVYIDHVIEVVKKYNCTCGLSFDGGGERCLAVDENGRLVDGDEIIALCTDYFHTGGLLRHNTLAVTASNNLGLSRFARKKGINIVSCGMDERQLIHTLTENGYTIGGDPAGHIIFPDDAPSADGQLTGVRLLEVLAQSDKSLSQMTGIMTKLPQVMINVPISYRYREVWKNDRRITMLIEDAEEELGIEGRILVREDGWSPKIRILVEGSDFPQINRIATEVADMIKERCPNRNTE
ncbi:MAG: phosphoglucosamine mutase [Ruminococcus sp.]|nr:phosphoglucosamine mutase [Ruminococcus sp.]MBR2282980.1 phosphoglucosamine mutase [Ruminococcus sp.]